MSQRDVELDNSPETLLEIHYTMLLSRRFEERLAVLYRQGKVLGGIFSGIGQEAVCVGTAFDLNPDDFVMPVHRDIGVCIARGVSPRRLMAQILAKATGFSGGKSDYLHGGEPELGVYGSTSMVASGFPVAAGAALAFKLQLSNRVAVTYCGEGATSRGDFHEALNFAAVQRLPAIFIVENNLYAYSTPVEKQFAIEDVADRGAAYGMPGRVVSGNDLLAVRRVMAEAVLRARQWLGPTLIECKTYRWHGHSEHDSATYRQSEEYLEWRSRDPIPRFEMFLREKGLLTDDVARRYLAEAEAEVQVAADFALNGPDPPPEEHDSQVYSFPMESGCIAATSPAAAISQHHAEPERRP